MKYKIAVSPKYATSANSLFIFRRIYINECTKIMFYISWEVLLK